MKGAGLGAWRLVVLAVFGAAGIALTGCASGAGATTGATVPDTTIPPANSFAVPAHITVAYVQRVLNALEAVDGDAGTQIVTHRELTPTAISDLGAIFVPSLEAAQVNLWVEQIASGLVGFKNPIGVPHDNVVDLLSADKSCVFLTVHRDVSAITYTPPIQHLTYVQLVPRTSSGASPNPTPWRLAFLGETTDGGSPTNPCV